MERWLRKETIYQGDIFAVVAGKVLLDDGRTASREMVAHRGGVAVVPVLDEDVLLIRQFRIAIECEILEIPAGRLEPGDLPEARARMELEEETGYRAQEMILTTSYFSSAGFTDERMYIYLAFGLQEGGQRLEYDERVERVLMPISEVKRKLAAAEFEDAKTIIGLNALLAHLE